ncbi:histidinol-phosphate transaminase [Streptomyces sp. LUP30]|uniref:pyridoxal phosphate-dependent aminotransferase n=1 Tax=Streptomyces sp. LUP30 TaxID=1890285 RepID=UPI0008518896|nr:histidinol-phosphate transaminase [Streptomyces sp. LUP30]
MATALTATSEILGSQGEIPDGREQLRLHFNESPYGAPAEALDAAAEELRSLHTHYPDHECTEIRERIARSVGVTPDMVAVANGADELIQLISLTFLTPSSGRPAAGTVAVTEQTFPGYAAAAAVAGADPRPVPLADHRVCPSAMAEALRDGARLAFVCNPHNPSGTVLDRAEVGEIIDVAEETGAVAVFDEAYIEFAAPEHDVTLDAVRRGRRALVMRTFSKAWGLAALRIGYLVGPADLVGRIRATRQSMPFSVNRIAQRAAVTALDHPEFLAGVRERTAAARERLVKGLEAAGLDPVPSEANFVLVRTGADSTAVAGRLAAEHGVLVRDLAPLGKPGYLRVTVGTEEQVDRFCTALSAVVPHTVADIESE